MSHVPRGSITRRSLGAAGAASSIGPFPDVAPASIPLNLEMREVVFARFMTTVAKIANSV